MLAQYTIEFFGGLTVRSETNQEIVRFRSQKAASLLAYLAYHRDTLHPREVLAEMFWGEDGVRQSRASLSVALSSLRKQLEPPGVEPGSIIKSDTTRVGLSEAVKTDVAAFEALLDRARLAASPAEAVSLREKAASLYQPILPGAYADWVVNAQSAINYQMIEVLGHLATYYHKTGNASAASEVARKSLAMDEEGLTLPPALRALANASARRTSDSGGEKTNHLPRVLIGGGAQGTPQPKLDTPLSSSLSGSIPLVHSLSPFFGRERERDRMRALLEDASVRLITLTGPGGVGKSRLSFVAAQDVSAARPDTRLCFGTLTDVIDRNQIRGVVRQALRLAPEKAEADSPDEEIVDALRANPRPTLLLLDGAEHVADLVGDLLVYLLARAPSLTCIVTSRQKLLREGEWEVAVGPLPVPPPAILARDIGSDDIDGLLTNWPSLALFANRARKTLADFVISPTNIDEVATLVRRLEGIPLSLELAAARMQAFTPGQMVQHMEHRFDLLQKRRKRSYAERESGSSRLMSLRETIAWSFELLSPELRRVMEMLSVFRGGWTVESAAAVLPLDIFGYATESAASHALDVGEALSQLRDASLLRVVSEGGAGANERRRFLVLDTIREFVDQELSPESREEAHRAHANHFLSFCEEAESHLDETDNEVWLDRLACEHLNLIVGLEWCAKADDVDEVHQGLRMAISLYRYWLIRGHLREGRFYFQRFLNHRYADNWTASVKAVAGNRAAVLAMTQGDTDAAEKQYRETLTLRRALMDSRGIAATLNNLAILACNQRRFEEARALNEESLTLWRELKEKKYIAVVLGNLGAIANDMEQPVAAQTYLEESIELHLSLQNKRAAAISLLNLGESALKHGNYGVAQKALLESLSYFQPAQDVQGCANALLCLGVLARESGQLKRSKRLIETAVTAYRAFGIALPAYLAEKVGESLVASEESGKAERSVSDDSVAESVLALRLLTQIVLDGWEDVTVEREEPVRLRLVG